MTSPMDSSSAREPRPSRWKGLLQKMGGSPASGIPSPIKLQNHISCEALQDLVSRILFAGYSFDKSIADVSANQYHHYMDDVCMRWV